MHRNGRLRVWVVVILFAVAVSFFLFLFCPQRSAGLMVLLLTKDICSYFYHIFRQPGLLSEGLRKYRMLMPCHNAGSLWPLFVSECHFSLCQPAFPQKHITNPFRRIDHGALMHVQACLYCRALCHGADADYLRRKPAQIACHADKGFYR